MTISRFAELNAWFTQNEDWLDEHDAWFEMYGEYLRETPPRLLVVLATETQGSVQIWLEANDELRFEPNGGVAPGFVAERHVVSSLFALNKAMRRCVRLLLGDEP